jgi:protein tyrosine/serine phosphatase
MTQDRVLPLDSVYNFRDYGGYAVAGGGRVRTGALWRSAQHATASDADLTTIDALGLATVVDLRGGTERAANPCRRGPGFAAQVWSQDGETAGLAPHVEAAGGGNDAATARRAMIGLYTEIPWRENLRPMLACYFRALARDPRPSLVHCVAGKDRTGFAVAVLQRLLGVHPDDVMTDYLLTNEASRLEQRIASGAMHTNPYVKGRDEASVRALWGVEAAYLDASFAALNERHPSIEHYLETVLEIDPEQQRALRQHYVE